jgi:hypothetical protein
VRLQDAGTETASPALYPRKRTLIGTADKSALCHFQTRAVQQRTAYSITSSAIASNAGAIFSPSVLPALSLIRDRRGWWRRRSLFVRRILRGQD